MRLTEIPPPGGTLEVWAINMGASGVGVGVGGGVDDGVGVGMGVGVGLAEMTVNEALAMSE